MRLSKTRREAMKHTQDHCISVLTESIRKERKEFNRIDLEIVQDETVKLNPKKDKSARRSRNPLPHNGLIFRKPSKNKYNPQIRAK